MSIKIKTKKVVLGTGEFGREIISCKALRARNLPSEYLDGDVKCYCYQEHPNSGLFFFKKNPDYYGGSYLLPGNIYSEEDFNKILEIIREAGDRLHEINAKHKAMKEVWNGEETFII